MTADRSILLLGESNVGKTHYGAQLLKRLIIGGGALRMDGAATNLQPFEDAMASLAEGRATGHTSAGTYLESVWPVVADGVTAQIVWPDYGGEQLRGLVTERKVPTAWQGRVATATDWVLLVRLHTMHMTDDIFSRPLASLGGIESVGVEHKPSDQTRLIEMLQILLYVAGLARDRSLNTPTLTVLLSCWDEIGQVGTPREILARSLPLLTAFVDSNWTHPAILGLSALEKSLSQDDGNRDYAIKGPERFGYVVQSDGSKSADLTLPIRSLLKPAV